MRISGCVRLAVRNLWAHKGRTLLNMLGIGVGVASVLLVFCLGQGGEEAVSAELKKYGINSVALRADEKGKLTLEDYIYLNSVMGDTLALTPVYLNYAKIWADGIQRNVLIWGVGENATDIYPIDLLQGRMFQNRLGEHVGQAVIDTVLARQLFGTANKIGQQFTIKIKNQETSLVVAGVFASSDEQLQENFSSMPTVIYVPVDYAMQLFGSRYLDSISLKTTVQQEAEKQAVQAVELLERKHQGNIAFYAENMSAQKEMAETVLKLMQLVLGAIALVSAFVGGFGIMNVMVLSVNERKEEIGMLKALGAQKHEILLEFLLESIINTLLGAAAGIVGGVGIAAVVACWLQLPFRLSPRSLFTILFIMGGIGAICGVYPARRAAALDPAVVLR